ncbi:hypothetical protein CPB83DRAFT_898454 [Crepidotus variabilis]|uniref:RING-type domain-containing protein n=1 Tax=Crepidotus variabilis TaxID=179855 RepID=A0A9P6E6Y5_9AGAR|nr:hypothetical protein CPB83DRAFT_898454 [Crepidotus variabilis]
MEEGSEADDMAEEEEVFKLMDIDGSVDSTDKKGKGRAVEPTLRRRAKKRKLTPVDTLEHEDSKVVSLLKTENALLKEELGKEKQITTCLQPHLTCIICLDLLHSPFAVVPCGHIVCYHCLVKWFCAPQAPLLAQQIQTTAENADSDVEIDQILSSGHARAGVLYTARRPVLRVDVNLPSIPLKFLQSKRWSKF